MGKIDYNRKIHKLNMQLAKLQKRKMLVKYKIEREERKKRAKKLLKLGLIFEITVTDIYSKEIIIEHFMKFRNSDAVTEDINKIGNSILEENNLFIHDKLVCLSLSTQEKKQRNHKLISLGALYEKANIENIALETLVGYTEMLHCYSEAELKHMKEKGKQYFKF